MNLLHPSSVGAPVALWFANGMPARIVYAGARYRVVDTATPTDSGWILRARTELGQEYLFEVNATDSGWELARAS